MIRRFRDCLAPYKFSYLLTYLLKQGYFSYIKIWMENTTMKGKGVWNHKYIQLYSSSDNDSK